MKFTFISVDVDGSKATCEFETENWVETFPSYLQFLRGSGFYIPDNTVLTQRDSYLDTDGESWTED
jgi:hypothetical protein